MKPYWSIMKVCASVISCVLDHKQVKEMNKDKKKLKMTKRERESGKQTRELDGYQDPNDSNGDNTSFVGMKHGCIQFECFFTLRVSKLCLRE